MSNIERYNQVFRETFNIEDSLLEGLTYQSIKSWDSVGHMTMIAAMEEVFDIMVDMDDIIDFSSYEKGQEILSKNYGIQF